MTDAPAADPKHNPEFLFGDASMELASQRTAMAFDRTGQGSDRTLMAVMRTSISLIGFGFSIYSFFSKVTKVPGVALPEHAPRNFGLTLIVLGVLILSWGIVTHYLFARRLFARRLRLQALGLIRHADKPHTTAMGLVALVLLLVGALVLFNLVAHTGPFS